ncbi:MAG: glycosyltransferase, partial [Nitrososphaera sp.]|nr:glycosyltransferase [Nitrososphaera sp.]
MPRGTTFVFLATHWGSKHGGINALNRYLASATSEVLLKRGLDAAVLCVVSEPPGEASSKVRLLHNTEFFPPELRDLPKRRTIVVGHDLITGPQALTLADSLGWEALVIMHSSYSEHHSRKSKDPETAIGRERAQQNLFKSATHTFGIGPLLTTRLKDMGIISPRTINPGLTVMKDFIIPDSRLRAVIHGRLGLEDDAVKQVQISCAGFCAAIKSCELLGREAGDRLKDAELKLIGVTNKDITHFKRLTKHYAGRSIDFKPILYVDDHEALVERMRDSNLGLYLSWYEGFGLAAWEAIGLGIPVIVSKRMGVYRMLEQIGRSVVRFINTVDITERGRPDSYGVHKHDLKTVQDTVLAYSADVKDRILDARNLRDILCKSFTWDNAATQFLADLNVLSPEFPHRNEDFIVEAIAKQDRKAVEVLV